VSVLATDSGSLFDKIPLSNFFWFADESWIEITEGSGMRSIDDELEFYELVDMDAEVKMTIKHSMT